MDAVCSKKYAKASWYCVVIAFLHIFTGLDALTIFSNTMIRQMEGFPLTPTEGTYVIGIFNFIGAMIAPFIFPLMTRRFNLLYGHLTMGVCMMLIAIFTLYKFIGINLFSVLF